MRERRDDFVSESHVRRTRLMRPFIEWLSNVARVAQVHDQLESITAKVINRRLWPAWSSWVEHSASRTRSEGLGRLVAIKLEALALLRALNAWAEMPCSNAATSWRVSKADSHLMLRHTSRAWNTWAACVAQHCLCALAYGSALRALRHRFIEIGWLAWQDYVANRGFRALRIRRLEELSRMERTVAHIYHRSVAPAWQTWAVYRSSRAAFVAARKRSLLLLARLVWQQDQARLAAGLQLWRQQSFDPAAQRREAVVQKRKLITAFRTWRRTAQQRSEMHLTMRQGEIHWSGRQMGTALASLHAQCDELRRLVFFGARERNRQCIVGWNTWVSILAIRQAILKQRRASAIHLRYRRLSLGFAAIATVAHKGEKWRSLLNRLAHERRTRAWHLWADSAASSAVTRVRTRRVVALRVYRGLESAVRHWQESISARSAKLEGLRRALAKLLNKQLRRCWWLWARHVHQMIAWHAWVRRWSAGTLVPALRVWHEQASARGKATRLLLKGAAANIKIVHRRLSLAWNVWASATLDAVRRLHSFRRVALRITSIRYHRVLCMWASNAQAGSARRALMKRGRRIMMYQQLTAGIRRWQAMCDEHAKQRYRIGHMLSVAKTHALRVWRVQTLRGTRAGRLSMRVQRRHRVLAWDTWASYACIQSAKLAVLCRVVLVLRKRQLRSFWRLWAHHVHQMTRWHAWMRRRSKLAGSLAVSPAAPLPPATESVTLPTTAFMAATPAPITLVAVKLSAEAVAAAAAEEVEAGEEAPASEDSTSAALAAEAMEAMEAKEAAAEESAAEEKDSLHEAIAVELVAKSIDEALGYLYGSAELAQPAGTPMQKATVGAATSVPIEEAADAPRAEAIDPAAAPEASSHAVPDFRAEVKSASVSTPVIDPAYPLLTPPKTAALRVLHEQTSPLSTQQAARAKILSAHMLNALCTWSTFANYSAAWLRLLHTAAVELGNLNILASFGMWRGQRNLRADTTRKLQLARSSFFTKHARATLNKWKHAADDSVLLRHVHIQAASHAAVRSISLAWRSWDKTTQQALRLRQRAIAALAARIRRSFKSWYSHARVLSIAEQSLIRLLNHGISTWRVRWLRAAFKSWSEAIQEPAINFRLNVRAAAHVASANHRRCMEALDGWISLMQQRQLIVKRIILRRALYAWAARTYEVRRKSVSPAGSANASPAQKRPDDVASLLSMLSPAQLAQWPKGWLDAFGWHLTWRVVPEWLDFIGLIRLKADTSYMQSDVLMLLCEGGGYEDLVELVELAHSMRETLPRDDVDLLHGRDWMTALFELFRSDLVESLFGDDKCTELGNRLRRGTGMDHLAILTTLRVLIEIGQPNMRLIFVDSMAARTRQLQVVQMPRFTRRNPLDDPSEVPECATCNYVCLGCPTPRILFENMRCGKCASRATVSTEEYLSTYAHNQQVLFDRNH